MPGQLAASIPIAVGAPYSPLVAKPFAQTGDCLFPETGITKLDSCASRSPFGLQSTLRLRQLPKIPIHCQHGGFVGATHPKFCQFCTSFVFHFKFPLFLSTQNTPGARLQAREPRLSAMLETTFRHPAPFCIFSETGARVESLKAQIPLQETCH